MVVDAPSKKTRKLSSIQFFVHLWVNLHNGRLSNKRGFSLTELMIVVAIIGALTVIGLPKFDQFLKRSKQTQAKIIISNVNTSLDIFHAEWGMYFNDFRDLGYAPEGDFYYDFRLSNYHGSELPSNYPKTASTGFEGSTGAGNKMSDEQLGYSQLYYYCNGHGEESWAPALGSPRCRVFGPPTHSSSWSIVLKEKYAIVLQGNLDEDDVKDTWIFCKNFANSSCPSSNTGLKLHEDDSLY